MSTIQFLADWALRSSILILSGILLLRLLRVKDPAIRLAAWTAILFGSLALPALGAMFPKLSLPVVQVGAQPVKNPVVVSNAAPAPMHRASGQSGGPLEREEHRTTRFDWARAGVILYILIAFALLLRLCLGLAMSLRLLRASRATGEATEGIELRESDRVTAPLALGIWCSAIVLPTDWRQWTAAKRNAVLAHERSHIQRRDPALQLLSLIHRALLWFSPLSWFLHNCIVRAAEEASDDAAIAVTRDRVFYAEVLLEFMQRGVRRASWLGAPMARYGQPHERIHRILDGTLLSHGITRFSVAVILAAGSPLAYVVAAAHPHSSSQAEIAPPPAPDQSPGETKARSKPVPKRTPGTHELNALGTVTAFNTVNVRSRVDGQLMSVSFKEGERVQAGQLLASIDPRPYQIELSQAQGQLAQDQAQLAGSRGQPAAAGAIAQLEGKVRSDQANVDSAKLQLTYARVTAPISGVAGLRLIDPGNIVRAADPTGILIITQVQPIAVVFTLAEEYVFGVQSRLREGANLSVEARNRTNTATIATGRVIAVDNLIDVTTGTGKVKAVFENKDGTLFPNQFVNIHLLDSRP